VSISIEPQPIPTTGLRIGMYVSKLDRPWIETPFLFQGFLIETLEVIEELRRYCKFVYVDVERSDCTIVQPLPSGKSAARHSGERPKGPVRDAAPAVPAKASAPDTANDTALLKAELAKARQAHDAAERVVKDLFQSIRSGEEINVTDIQKSLDPMIDSITRNDDALSWLMRMKKKDDYVYSHSIASAVWSLLFGKHLGLEPRELNVLATGMIFMDVGKTKIPTQLLTKPDALTADEMRLMQTHVTHGVAIIGGIRAVDPRVIEMVRCHHERYNGTGYPRGLSGSAIPIFARIAGVIDTYDAMTSARPYARRLSSYDATRQLTKLAGVEFPAEVVEQFIQAIGVFPVGTLVELNTGEVGMVIAQNRVRRLRPKVILLLDRDKTPLETFSIIDLRNQLADAHGENSLWIERGLAPGEYGLDPTEYYLQDV
jgi:HD-GYP domain-containing protein (c-di-GMP phosphodiesterase class II)